MKIRKMSFISCLSVFLLATCGSVFPQGKFSSAVGDVQFQFIGHASLPSPPPALAQTQYGYLTYVNGISGAETIFNPGPQNEATALFTFYADTIVERLTINGPLRIFERLGTMTIYLDTTPDGDFANPDSFRDGLPVQTSELRLQAIQDTLTGVVNVTSVHTITSSDFFHLGFSNFLLGKAGQKFRRVISGHVNMSGSPAAHIAGFAVGDLKR